MERLMREVKAQLESWEAWESAKTIVLAVSGGVDSMVLLRLMHELQQLRQNQHKQIIVAHFNHRLRAESDVEAERIEAIVKAYDCVYFTACWDTPATHNIEAQAREARYQFFASVIRATDADMLMTAHHLNDVAETFLMRLTRGTSLKGLQGIKGCSKRLLMDSQGHTVMPYVVRPFIHIPKAQLVAYAAKFNVTYFEDASNEETVYLRNRFRKQYLPQLLQENPQLLHNIATMQQQLQDSYQVHYKNYLAVEPQLLMYSMQHYWLLYIPAFLELESAQFNLYLNLFFEERLIEDIPRYRKDVVVQLQQMIKNRREPNQRLQLGQGWIAVKRYDYIQILPESAIESSRFGERLVLARTNRWYQLDDDVQVGIFSAHQVSPEVRFEAIGWLALRLDEGSEAKQLNYYLRHRLPGDVAQLQDENGHIYHKKISRLLIDAKIPADERDKMWLLCHPDDAIIWVGPNVSSRLYHAEQTDKITHIFLYRKMNPEMKESETSC